MTENINEIKDALKQEILVVGSERTIKELKASTLSKVMVSYKLDKEKKDEIERLCKLAGVELEILKIDNEEIGTICKKPFSIAVLSIKKV